MFQSVAPIELTPQQGRVMNYLKGGSTLTNMVALNGLGVGSLTSRIAELRKLGFPITDRFDVDQFNRQYKKYDLDATAPCPAFTVKGE
jgi:hypothetical protein